jgi:hypothetical protein
MSALGHKRTLGLRHPTPVFLKIFFQGHQPI